MATTAAEETYYSLAPLGFDGWEHTEALTAENGTKSLFLRREGHLLPHLVVSGRGGMLSAITALIENQTRFGALRDH